MKHFEKLLVAKFKRQSIQEINPPTIDAIFVSAIKLGIQGEWLNSKRCKVTAVRKKGDIFNTIILLDRVACKRISSGLVLLFSQNIICFLEWQTVAIKLSEDCYFLKAVFETKKK